MSNFNIQLKTARLLAIGLWFAAKYQLLAAESGTERAARNLRKQGVPLQLALKILAYR